MKGAIASVEIFVFSVEEAVAAAPTAAPAPDEAGPRVATVRTPRRLSLVIGVPERAPAGGLWHCRVALADLHRPETFSGRDSVEALFRAVERARVWLAALDAEGFALYRDRAGNEPFSLPSSREGEVSDEADF